MAKLVVMPKPDVMTDEVVFVNWLKEVGEEVKKDESLFIIETEKSELEIESPFNGILLEKIAVPDETYPVGAPLAVIGTKDEDYDLQDLIKNNEQENK